MDKNKQTSFRRPKRKNAAIVFCSVLILITAFIIYGNTAITVTDYVIEDKNIPESFSGFTIVQVSDLHNAEFGKDNRRLLSKIRNENPDIIVITGDIIDYHRTDINIALSFVNQALTIAPVYFVSGNHEAIIDEYDVFLQEATEAGMVYLENKTKVIETDGESINLTGIDDPFILSEHIDRDLSVSIDSVLSRIMPENGYTILLAHRPTYFNLYCKHSPDLILSGHAHGGQFRLPFIGGLYAPEQGIFPEYDAGLYENGSIEMIVSRGIGNSRFPFRINNTPELITVKLMHSVN